MPILQVYQAINDPTRYFNGRAEYLDYLRVRRTERLAWGRLCAGRAKALERLHEVRLLSSWSEVEEFINDHTRDIDLIADSEYQLCDFKISINGEGYRKGWSREHPIGVTEHDHDVAYPVFMGYYEFRYRKLVPKRKRKNKKGSAYRDLYDLPYRSYHSSHTDALSAIGLHSRGGGGSGRYRYEMFAFQQDFDHLRVMQRLAA